MDREKVSKHMGESVELPRYRQLSQRPCKDPAVLAVAAGIAVVVAVAVTAAQRDLYWFQVCFGGGRRQSWVVMANSGTLELVWRQRTAAAAAGSVPNCLFLPLLLAPSGVVSVTSCLTPQQSNEVAHWDSTLQHTTH